ncbi:hypothetical protein, partial [Endozoicomonas sp. YOMI1]|uniref:hypothetical protein n=1 Tax=Endozoicomonas sp. YOMI1 TaxID=2828739 RepID=UPI002148350F
MALPAAFDQLQPTDAGENYPVRGKNILPGCNDYFCSNPMHRNSIESVPLNTPLIGERKVCPLFRGGLSELVKSSGLVVGAEGAENQERHTNILSQELQPQPITQGTGPALTDDALSKLNKDLIRAIKYSHYDKAELFQRIIESTGAKLTDDAQSKLIEFLEQAIGDTPYQARLLSDFAGFCQSMA